MIELDMVSRRYGRRGAGARALHDVSLQIPAGSIWAVVGPNGAGKSTLLSLVLGFIRPTAGSIRVHGLPPREYVRYEGAAYLPERFTIPHGWQVGSALRMFARLEGGTAADAQRALAQLGLEAHAHRRAGELSRGLLQRVGIAQALLAQRALVVLDEPTEGLDPVWRIRLRDIVAGLRADGRIVLIASHDLAEIERTADQVLLLEQGARRGVLHTRADGAAAAAAAPYRITLLRASAAVAEIFPGAVSSGDGLSWQVTAASPVELSERVGGLVAAGAVITAVEPLYQPLEERVRAALREES
jgi:ABC-type Mn2+/Zn2+ transport system ATPase subunit